MRSGRPVGQREQHSHGMWSSTTSVQWEPYHIVSTLKSRQTNVDKCVVYDALYLLINMFQYFRCQWTPQTPSWRSQCTGQKASQLQTNCGPFDSQLQGKSEDLQIWWNHPGKNGFETWCTFPRGLPELLLISSWLFDKTTRQNYATKYITLNRPCQLQELSSLLVYWWIVILPPVLKV